jgi:hypothetical protein
MQARNPVLEASPWFDHIFDRCIVSPNDALDAHLAGLKQHFILRGEVTVHRACQQSEIGGDVSHGHYGVPANGKTLRSGCKRRSDGTSLV